VAKLEPITLEAWVQEGGSSKPFVTPEEEQAEKARVMARLASSTARKPKRKVQQPAVQAHSFTSRGLAKARV